MKTPTSFTTSLTSISSGWGCVSIRVSMNVVIVDNISTTDTTRSTCWCTARTSRWAPVFYCALLYCTLLYCTVSRWAPAPGPRTSSPWTTSPSSPGSPYTRLSGSGVFLSRHLIIILTKILREIFGPLYGEEREQFLSDGGISFIVVRDPFERLVSAYLVMIIYPIKFYIFCTSQDKISKKYTRDSVEWESFGVVQDYIRDNIRKETREGLVPTFAEFAEYITEEVAELNPRINNHWKPIYYNCAPCIEK